MTNDELNRNLWEAIRSWREMYLRSSEPAWDALMAVPDPDFHESHDIYCAIEHDHLGCRVVMTDATNQVVERIPIKGVNE